MDKKDQLKYIPLQPEERDLALYLQKKWIWDLVQEREVYNFFSVVYIND